MIDKGKLNLIGVNVNAVDYDAAVHKIVDAAKNREPLGVSALAVHGVMEGFMDDEHRHRLNQLELVVPDGQPVRWALNLAHKAGLSDRVYGPNLMLRTCEAAEKHGIPIHLFGGKPELLEALSAKLLERMPNLKIVGTTPSKFRTLTGAEEKQELIDTINASGAAITFVGLGCPRQEVWAYEFKDHLRMPVIAVGAAFNFHAGELDQAPPFMQKYGLEWFYRLVKEPKRLWHRYMVLNPYYVSQFALQWTGLKKFNPDSAPPPAAEVLYG